MEKELPYIIETKLKRFSRVTEGGAGKPLTIFIHLLLIGFLFLGGISLTSKVGISSGGPAMIFLSAFWLVGLFIWICIKAGMRDRNVIISIDAASVKMLPSAKQRNLDKKLRLISLLLFWLTLKGGQWSAWQSSVKWNKVKKVVFYDLSMEILIKGGPWDIRIPCFSNNYILLKSFIVQKVKKVENR